MVINKYTDDNTIVSRFREGDDDAYNNIVSRFYDDVLSLSYFILLDEKRARDFTKMFFYEIYFNRNKLNYGEDIKNMLFYVCWCKIRKIDVSKYSEISISLKADENPLESHLIYSLCKLNSSERYLLYFISCLKYDYLKLANLLQIKIEKVKNIYTKIIFKTKKSMDRYLNENYKEIKLLDNPL